MPEALEAIPLGAKDSELDKQVFRELAEIRRTQEVARFEPLTGAQPDVVDLSPYLHFIRRQGGPGCWGYSMLAVWDIMNEMVCPFSPTLSMRIWMMLHKRSEMFQRVGDTRIWKFLTPDGRFFTFQGGPEFGFFQRFGNVTEGTEPTMDPPYPSEFWPDGGWSTEGMNEASNYKLASLPRNIDVSADSFISALSQNKSIRLGISWLPDGGHFEAVVGYDKKKQTFKYVNSDGDKWGDNGFSTYTFAEINAKKSGNLSLDTGEVIDVVPPKPVPAARIQFHHADRGNVHLWIGAENSAKPPHKIWPHCWDDNSRNLDFTVRLPAGFVWPPLPENRVYLDLFDAGTYSHTGGSLVGFTAAFGGDVRPCAKLQAGPLKFATGEFHRTYLP